MQQKSEMKRVTLLSIDDNVGTHKLVDYHLEGVVDRFLHARGGAEGMRLALEQQPDVILMDVGSSDNDGFEICRQLKEMDMTRDIPILFMTGKNTAFQAAKALDSGGTDYVTKKFEAVELQARVRAAVRTKRLVDLLKDRARIDALTGLENRIAFDQAIKGSVSRHRRRGVTIGLLMLNVDFLRQINEEHGYTVGDDIVMRVGMLLGAEFRPDDTACRFANDTFAIILCPTSFEGARQTSERALAKIRDLVYTVKGKNIPISVSGGLVVTPKSATRFSPDQLADQALNALAQAKSQGRGMVVAAWAREQTGK